MDHEEFDKVISLGKAAYEATQKAKIAYNEYATAASAAYISHASTAAKVAYEASIASGNFEAHFVDRINKDFKTDFNSSDPIRISPTPIATPATVTTTINTISSDNTPTKSEAGVVKPLRDLFTMEYESEQEKNKVDEGGGWQSRG